MGDRYHGRASATSCLVRNGRFAHHSGCNQPVEVRGGFPRCCRCGGSLYMERADNLVLSRHAYAIAAAEANLAS